jgi:hypothetical protein
MFENLPLTKQIAKRGPLATLTTRTSISLKNRFRPIEASLLF